MPLETVIIASVLSKFAPIMRDLVAEMLRNLERSQPLKQLDNSDFSLERPENRMGFGKKLIGGKEVLAICLERPEGPAYNEAVALQKESPDRVAIEVVGYAQSVWPIPSKQPAGPMGKTLQPGSSVAHIHGWAGSLGAFVKFRYPKSTPIYKGFTSAAHVLGVNNSAERGDYVISPGRPDIDPPTADYKVGKIGSYVYLTHYKGQNDPEAVLNRADIATVELDDETQCPQANLVPNPSKPSAEIPITGVLTPDELIARLDEPVYMVGRTSGFSSGSLDVAGVAAFPVKLPSGKAYLYGELNVVKPMDGKDFSAPGDSGSLVYTKDGKAAGFLVAGSPTRSFFHAAHSCLKAVNAQLV
jgi:hypothetical protein